MNLTIKFEFIVKCRVNKKRSYVYSAAYFLYLSLRNEFCCCDKSAKRLSKSKEYIFSTVMSKVSKVRGEGLVIKASWSKLFHLLGILHVIL